MAGPTEYVKRYHELLVNDTAQDIFQSVDIRNYNSGWSPERQTEYDLLVNKLAPKTGSSALPLTFYVRNDSRMDNSEVFYRHSLRRAYLGKGSPEEIIDALRLATLCGLIKPGRAGAGDLATYVKTYIGLDCNGFVGNYFGLSPEVKPRAWAQGMSVPADDSAKVKAGITKAIALTLAYFPLTARTSADTIAPGDVVITVRNDAPVHSHEHIALVASVSVTGDTATIGLAEWGGAGGIATHTGTAVGVKLVSNAPATKQWRRYGLAWASGDAYRHIFAPPCPANSAGWGRCGQPEI